MRFGNRLRELLVKYQRSQRWLARTSGIHYVTINRILNDYPFNVTEDTARKIAKALGCSKSERDDLLRLAGGLPKDVTDAMLEDSRLVELVRREMRKKSK